MKRQLTVLIVAFLITPLQARNITVDLDGPADFNNIQAAIDDSNNGDIVLVRPGSYNESINFLGKGITVTSTNPTDSNVVAATIIQGSVVFRGTEDPNCMLTGFKISSAYELFGGIHGFDSLVDPTGESHTRATISHCVLQHNGTAHSTVVEACDGIISNCLIADNYSITYCPPSPVINNCHGLIKNCTIANNHTGVAVGGEGSTTLQNCIIYHNSDHHWAQISLGSGGTVNVSYCDVQDGLEEIYLEDSNCIVNWGPGNINTDPCFVRLGYWGEELELIEGDYYLQSAAGRWDPDSQTWVPDFNTSPCIDAGNPGCPVGDEPDPNGNRINMGAYGSTAEASKSPPDWALLSDMTNDRTNNFADLKVLVDYWLTAGQCLPADLDRSGFVDPADYSIFAQQFGQTASQGSGLNYQIGTCQSEPAASNSQQNSFSVWVVGRYLYFEDLIHANCCPDKLEIETIIDGNHITINEIETTTSGCRCTCDFPVTATLGPLDDGTYTIEVFDNYGQSKGTAQITIGP